MRRVALVAALLILQSTLSAGVAIAQAPHQPLGTVGDEAPSAIVNERLFADRQNTIPNMLQKAVARESIRLALSNAPSPVTVAAAQERVQPHERKLWRRVGAITAGAVGFLAYAPVAISDSRVGVSDTQRVLEHSAVTAGSAVLGYFIGRSVDRRKADGS